MFTHINILLRWLIIEFNMEQLIIFGKKQYSSTVSVQYKSTEYILANTAST